jgi:hypothetical protein
MERLKKIQKDHHYIVDWHIPKKKEDMKDIQSKQVKPVTEKVFIDYGHYTTKD